MFPSFGAVVDCIHTVVINRRAVVELRAVWRCVAYVGSVVGCSVLGWERGWMRAGLGCERVLDVGGVVVVNDGEWWSDGM